MVQSVVLRRIAYQLARAMLVGLRLPVASASFGLGRIGQQDIIECLLKLEYLIGDLCRL